MSTFENVTITKEVNSYFDGKVTSRSIVLADGSKKSLGVMLPGEYEFGTTDKEIMEIMSGDLDVMLSGHDDWQKITGPSSFEVDANSIFQLKVHSFTDYCCSYIS